MDGLKTAFQAGFIGLMGACALFTGLYFFVMFVTWLAQPLVWVN